MRALYGSSMSTRPSGTPQNCRTRQDSVSTIVLLFACTFSMAFLLLHGEVTTFLIHNSISTTTLILKHLKVTGQKSGLESLKLNGSRKSLGECCIHLHGEIEECLMFPRY